VELDVARRIDDRCKEAKLVGYIAVGRDASVVGSDGGVWMCV